MMGSFQEESWDTFRCNFGTGYGDTIKPMAACQHFAHIRNTHIHLKLYTSHTLQRKIKPQDKETVADKFLYFYENIKDRRFSCTFHKTNELGCHHMIRDMINPEPIWWIDPMWKQGKKQHITIQTNEIKLLRKYNPDKIHHQWRVIFEWDKVIKKLEQFNLPLVHLDYTMTVAEKHDILLNSAFHIGYSGSSTHLALALGVPVILLGVNSPLVPDIQQAAYEEHMCGYKAFTVEEFLKADIDIDTLSYTCMTEIDKHMRNYGLQR